MLLDKAPAKVVCDLGGTTRGNMIYNCTYLGNCMDLIPLD